MKAVVQVVKHASLIANGTLYSEIDKGFVVLLGISNTDTIKDCEYVANKIAKLLVFADQNDKLNLGLSDIDGQVLLVSNFTLYGSTKGTNRPDFINAAKPEIAKPLYDYFVDILTNLTHTKTGVFGADMQIEMCADGPCTIIIETEKKL